MIYLVLGGAVLAFLVWLGRRPARAGVSVRLIWTALSVAAAGGAVFVGLRGNWIVSLILVALSAYVGQLARVGGPRRAPPPLRRPPEAMSERQARSILGVSETAGRDEIEAAYRRLMRTAHPDHGGSTGLAAQINAARDRLLG